MGLRSFVERLGRPEPVLIYPAAEGYPIHVGDPTVNQRRIQELFHEGKQLDPPMNYFDEVVEDEVPEEDYDLGYVLGFSSYRYLLKSLEWAAEQGIVANPRFAGIHNIQLAESVSGYASDIRPTSLQEALETRDEIVYRLSIMPLNHEVDVKAHLLLSGVSWAEGYVKLLAQHEHLNSDDD